MLSYRGHLAKASLFPLRHFIRVLSLLQRFNAMKLSSFTHQTSTFLWLRCLSGHQPARLSFTNHASFAPQGKSSMTDNIEADQTTRPDGSVQYVNIKYIKDSRCHDTNEAKLYRFFYSELLLLKKLWLTKQFSQFRHGGGCVYRLQLNTSKNLWGLLGG